MKTVFNSIEFIVESAQWWIAPENLPSTKWVVGLKHTKEDGSHTQTVKAYLNQETAENALWIILKRIRELREARKIVVASVYNSLKLFDGPSQEKYSKYINYWLDKNLSPERVIARFCKDKDYKVPPNLHERPDSNRNPYYRIYNTDSIGGLGTINTTAIANSAAARQAFAESDLVTINGNEYTIVGNIVPAQADTLAHAQADVDDEAFFRQANEMYNAGAINREQLASAVRERQRQIEARAEVARVQAVSGYLNQDGSVSAMARPGSIAIRPPPWAAEPTRERVLPECPPDRSIDSEAFVGWLDDEE